MKRESLWEISVLTSLEAEEAVLELLGRVFNRAAVAYTNEETKITRASVYCQKRTEWTPAKRAELNRGLKFMQVNGLNCGIGKIVMQRVAKEDWSESWKRHFKPIEIGARLLIKPSWIKTRPKKNQVVVILDPGLSFGTGNHPTTSFCLGELVMNRQNGVKQSFWDVGTGSGILAIAAAKLGYAPVQGMDFDPEAVRVARENALHNHVAQQVRLSRGDVTKLPMAAARTYDFICANLISNLLMAEKRRIVNRLKPDGRLVLAGILEKEFLEVQKAFEMLGLKLAASRVEGEWRSGAFVFS